MLNAANPRIKVFVNFVKELSALSKCTDRGVAAIIINSEAMQVYSIGINGGPKGGEDCLCALGGKYSCIHAEANALAKCKTEDQHKIMICTLSPCVTCASLVVNSGFDAFFYLTQYKDDKGLEILNKAGIRTILLETDSLVSTQYTPPPKYVSPSILPIGAPPVTVTSAKEQERRQAAIDTFILSGSINIALSDEVLINVVKNYANGHKLPVKAAIDDRNGIIKIWKV